MGFNSEFKGLKFVLEQSERPIELKLNVESDT